MRAEKGEYKVLYPDLGLYEDRFFMMYRMSIDKFDKLLQMVTPLIEKQILNTGKLLDLKNDLF